MRRQTAEQRALEQEYLAGDISEQEYRHALRQIQRERAQAPRPHDVVESRGNIPTPTRIQGLPRHYRDRSR